MKRKITVFIASPGDLSNERKYFRETIVLLNVGFGDGANVEFEPLGWEDTLASTGRRSQGVINAEIDRCDVFILVLYRRWGQAAPDAKPYSSYTEEEFHRAFERWRKEGKPEIFVFFKRVEPESEADPEPQLKQVMTFRKQLEETRQVFYHYFDDKTSFVKEVDRHLRAYAKGKLPKADAQRDMVVLPLAALEEVEKAKAIAESKIQEAAEARESEKESLLKVEAMQLQVAEDAAVLAKEGKVEFARQKFAGIVVETTNLRILSLAYEFYFRTGDLDAAFSVLEKWLNISGPDEISPEKAIAYGNLGNLYQTRGDLVHAEEMYRKVLSINKVLGRQEDMTSAYGNLGIIYKTKGNLERAEDMYKKALAIDEARENKAGIAIAYSSLGILYKIRGNFVHAEDLYKKALAIDEARDYKVGMANSYGNLGNLYQARGDLVRAEAMYQKSLTTHEALGCKEGMANNYGNLGNLYMTRDDRVRAEKMYKKALAIYKTLGCLEGMANVYGNLGNLYTVQDNLDGAEAMYKKALAIHEALGCKEGMAYSYSNLGILCKVRDNLDSAETLLQKSLLFFNELGSPAAEQVSRLLNDLHNDIPD